MEKLDPITREEIFMAEAAGDSVPSLTPITRKEHFLKRIAENAGSGGGGTGGAQPDWNANEGEPGHILNRTHWMEEGVGDLVPLTTYIPALNESFGCTMHSINSFDLVVDKSYTVIFDGVEYHCTAKEINNFAPEISNVVYIGNDVFAGGENTGEPFAVACIVNSVVLPSLGEILYTKVFYQVLGMDTEQHSLRVIGEKPIYYKIPNEYTPKDCLVKFEYDIFGNLAMLTPWEEIIEAVKTNTNIYGVLQEEGQDFDQFGNLVWKSIDSYRFICVSAKIGRDGYEQHCEIKFLNTNEEVKVVNITCVRDENGITTITT